MAMNQALLAHLYTPTNTATPTENRVGQMNSAPGTHNDSTLILRVEPELTLNVSMPGNAVVPGADFLFGPKPAVSPAKPGQPVQSRNRNLQSAPFSFKDCLGLEDGSRKQGTFCTIPVCEMHGASMLQRRMGRSFSKLV